MIETYEFFLRCRRSIQSFVGVVRPHAVGHTHKQKDQLVPRSESFAIATTFRFRLVSSGTLALIDGGSTSSRGNTSAGLTLDDMIQMMYLCYQPVWNTSIY